jgi:hypothetical protein
MEVSSNQNILSFLFGPRGPRGGVLCNNQKIRVALFHLKGNQDNKKNTSLFFAKDIFNLVCSVFAIAFPISSKASPPWRAPQAHGPPEGGYIPPPPPLRAVRPGGGEGIFFFLPPPPGPTSFPLLRRGGGVHPLWGSLRGAE